MITVQNISGSRPLRKLPEMQAFYAQFYTTAAGKHVSGFDPAIEAPTENHVFRALLHQKLICAGGRSATQIDAMDLNAIKAALLEKDSEFLFTKTGRFKSKKWIIAQLMRLSDEND